MRLPPHATQAERARRKQLESELAELREKADNRAALERKILQLEARNEQLLDKIDRQEKYMKRKLGIASVPADEAENEPPRGNEEGAHGLGDDRKPARRSLEPEGRARSAHRSSSTDARAALKR